MKHHSTFAFFCGLGMLVLCMLPEDASSQTLRGLGRKLERKIQEKASRRAEDKVDKAIDKALDKAEKAVDQHTEDQDNDGDTPSKKAVTNSQEKGAPSASKVGSTKPLQEQYNFVLGIQYEMLEGEQKGRGTDVTLWVSEGPYLGMVSEAQKNAFMVMDDGQMIVFMEKEKSYMTLGGFASAITEKAVQATEENDAEFTFKKIGTEDILGYQCDIFEMKSEASEAKLWIAQHMGVQTANSMMQQFGTLMRKSKKGVPDLSKASGLMLKMESFDASKKEKITMVAKEVYKEHKKILSSDYTSMGF